MALSITSYINQVIAGQPKKPSPIHDALQAIQSWASAGLTASDLAANAGILASQTEIGAYTAPTAFTPVFNTSNGDFSLLNGTVEGYKFKVGRLVYMYAKLTFGGSTVPGTGDFRLTAPENILTGAPFLAGFGEAIDATGSTYPFYPCYNSTTTIFFKRLISNTGAAYPVLSDAILGGTDLVTWAGGDSITVSAVYLAAS
jgi:hypothetical protein